MRLTLLFASFALVACGASPKAGDDCQCAVQNRAAEPAIGAAADGTGGSNDAAALRAELAEVRAEVAALRARADQPSPRPAARPRRPRPEPTAVYAVPLDDSPWRGERHAPVTVVKGFEFACPFCERSRSTMDQLLADYKGDIKIVYKHFIVHPQNATEPARAACAAGLQGKFETYADLVWDEAYAKRDFDAANLERLARKAKLDMARFRRDRDGQCEATVRRDQSQLAKLGVTGTPSFYINGRFLSGARPVEQFKILVDEELARARKRIAGEADTNRENYYQRYVIEAGKTSLE